MEIRAIAPNEWKYTYSQSMQITGQTGNIGHLRGDFDSGGYGFYTTWNDHRPQWKTDEFKTELDEVINALRSPEYGLLQNRPAMSEYARRFPDSAFKGKGNTVETVVLLSRKTPDDTIEVDLDLDELDITSAESKATYQEIKDYVLKEFGLKVSTLYISQIKRKCGIEVGEHYNISQKENQKVPQCPKEKEDAIRAALEHFAMI